MRYYYHNQVTNVYTYKHGTRVTSERQCHETPVPTPHNRAEMLHHIVSHTVKTISPVDMAARYWQYHCQQLVHSKNSIECSAMLVIIAGHLWSCTLSTAFVQNHLRQKQEHIVATHLTLYFLDEPGPNTHYCS